MLTSNSVKKGKNIMELAQIIRSTIWGTCSTYKVTNTAKRIKLVLFKNIILKYT